MFSSQPHKGALETCTFCPSLCLHTCPVSTVEANQSVSPWAKMSLARYVSRGQVELTDDVAKVLYKCTGCGACTEWCRHDVDVPTVLFDARKKAIERGVAPYTSDVFEAAPAAGKEAVVSEAQRLERYQDEPKVLFYFGAQRCDQAPEIGRLLWDICAALEEDELALGAASVLDSGYTLWSAGHHAHFRAHATEVKARLDRSERVVVWSLQDLKVLRDVYPEEGLGVTADLLSVVDYFGPILTGAPVHRLKGRVGYLDSCLTRRDLGGADETRELLNRVLQNELLEFPPGQMCCGAGGCMDRTSPESSRLMARELVDAALRSGFDSLAGFGPECVGHVADVAGDTTLRVMHGLALIHEALAETP